MRRFSPALIALATAAIFLTDCLPASAQGEQQWGTLKGRIVWGGDKIPDRKKILVNVNAAHCLAANPTADAANSTILDESLLINAKNKGIKNVFVYLFVEGSAKLPIHPNLKAFPKEMVVDQPACMFWPRALVLRQGQTLVVKNSSPVDHSFRLIGDGVNNQGLNVIIKAGKQETVKDLAPQRVPLSVECNLHGWMKGRIAVVAHPYYAITDEEGNFEITDAPAGNFKLVIYHEDFGNRLGPKGKNGEPIVINAGVNNLGELPLGGK